MIIAEEDYLQHYGVLRRSGRYPWGSGKQNDLDVSRSFIDTVDAHRKEGLSSAQIAKIYSSKEHPLSSTDIIALKSIAKNRVKQEQIRQANRLGDEGNSNVAIGKLMGLNESSVRALREPENQRKADALQATAQMLRDQVAKKGYIDIGAGTHFGLNVNGMGISEDKLKVAVALLREEGYKVHYQTIPNLSSKGNETSLKSLGGIDSPHPGGLQNVHTISDQHTIDGGENWTGVRPPISISSKRVHVRYAEDGGSDADGVIFVRPNVKDLSIGPNQYAQVRIMVDNSHFLKGMAVQKDDLPEGVDLVFNTNKSNTGNKLDALKPLIRDATTGEIDSNPFGSIVRQIPAEGKVTSAMNLVGKNPGAGVEGGWGEWSRSLSSQVLSKQAPELAKSQLNMTLEKKRNELDRIKSLTNPVVKAKLLDSFAGDADSQAVHLKAAALPRQSTHVLLPVITMKPTEIFAPNYTPGERVVLIRYPHGGTFEIPELTVNNKNAGAIKLLGKSPQDAVGIHPSVAERLSGADFDGDTVLVIPNNSKLIEHQPALEGLKGFDPKVSYKIADDDKTTTRMTKSNTQAEMGKITNLISDMTIKEAGTDELAQAIRHSMVVIDAEKHGLDYKASYLANGIPALKAHYQGVHEKGNLKGAATLITRAKSDIRIDDRKLRLASEGGPIDRKTGEKVFTPTGKTVAVTKTVTDPLTGRKVKIDTGETQLKKQISTRLAETTDAHTLLSDHGGKKIERIYAEHSNSLKALANEARLVSLDVGKLPKASAATQKTYAPEIHSLNLKLNEALSNAPLERNAQRVANIQVRLWKKANPDFEKADVAKREQQILAEARVRTGAKKASIELTDREWEAIQAGAISHSKLTKIVTHSDLNSLKERATPHETKKLSAYQITRAKTMLANGYTEADVLAQLGVGRATLARSVDLKEGEQV